MKSQRSRIFGGGNWTKRNKDGGRESKKSVRMANTEVCQRCTKILGIGELLLLIY